MKKILITAFEPFGLTGRFLRAANASLDIMNNLKTYENSRGCEFLVLPVSPEAPRLLAEHLQNASPAAVLNLGEDLAMFPGSIRIEGHAYDMPASLHPFPALSGKRKLHSDFVLSTYGKEAGQGIGAYFCNDVYRTSLKWAEHHQQEPVAFAHIAVAGDRNTQTDKVLALLTELQQATRRELA